MTEIWVIGGFFAFVLTAVFAAGYLFQRGHQPSDQNHSAVLSGDAGAPVPSTVVLELFRSIGETFPGAKNANNPHRVNLASAGYRWASALPVYYGIKCGSALFMSGVFGIVALLYDGDPSAALLPMACGLGLGFLLPDRILSSRIRARAQRLRHGILSAIDLIVLGLEAGQALDPALADASRGLKRTYPELSAELAQLYLELRTSSSRADSFRSFGARNKEPELRKLANLLVDGDRFGTSLGPALRSHAKFLRSRFRQQAQEKARKVGVKLIFPVFFLIFPSVLLVTLGPACIMMFQQLKMLML